MENKKKRAKEERIKNIHVRQQRLTIITNSNYIEMKIGKAAVK